MNLLGVLTNTLAVLAGGGWAYCSGAVCRKK